MKIQIQARKSDLYVLTVATGVLVLANVIIKSQEKQIKKLRSYNVEYVRIIKEFVPYVPLDVLEANKE